MWGRVLWGEHLAGPIGITRIRRFLAARRVRESFPVHRKSTSPVRTGRSAAGHDAADPDSTRCAYSGHGVRNELRASLFLVGVASLLDRGFLSNTGGGEGTLVTGMGVPP